QGHEFDSAILADVLELHAADTEERLEVLDKVHGFVRLVRESEFPDRTLSLRYAFVHSLYQNALCAALQPTRRATISLALGQAIAKHCQDKVASAAAELAVLFETGRDWLRAAEFHHRAAENAARFYAHQEAVALTRRGLEQLRKAPESAGRAV